MRRWMCNNGLSIALFSTFLLLWAGQSVAGWQQECQQERQRGLPQESYLDYLASGDFWEATGENWESEFLQMAAFVILACFLYQKGSAEGKSPDERTAEDEDPAAHRNDPAAPWPVRRGGWALRIYSHSLSIALGLLFLGSIALHAVAGARQYNEEQMRDGLPTATFWEYVTGPTFWFQSLQNWQSEFLAIFCMVVLTVFLRQKNSPQSKPVHAPHRQNK